ncbi:MAG: double-strand break repair protein AddB [Pseudomonadota bacterium]
MSKAGPQVFTIPAGNNFVEVLAAGLSRQAGDAPLALAGFTLLLPNRRAVQALREAFLRLTDGAPTLLPRMIPLGDLEAEELALESGGSLGAARDLALPPAAGSLQRLALLSPLVSAWMAQEGKSLPAAATLRLARALALLIDEAETAEIDWSRLEDLVPEELAAHWQTTRRFLSIVTEAWPGIEATTGLLGPAARRRLLLDAQAALWQEKPPAGPVIAAGSTGSIPAVARLLATVARLPQGQVVLPGLDQACSSLLWEEIEQDPSHPQYGLAQLLAQLKIAPRAVPLWPEALPESNRAGLANLALRPAPATASWPDVAKGVNESQTDRWHQALDGLTWYDCADPRAEACLIALLLRQSLETAGKTAALVTPDRGLARRVAAELARWDIAINDSAGQPLLETPPLAFLRLLAKAVAEELAPEALLALLKHPLTALGGTRARLAEDARLLERWLLRGPRPEPGFAGLHAALSAARKDPRLRTAGPWDRLEDLLARLEVLLDPLVTLSSKPSVPLAELLDAQLQTAEALAASDSEAGGSRLWAGEAGEAAVTALAELREAAPDLADLAPVDYPALFDALLEGQVLRPRYGLHPRLFIWGPLEARLQRCDLLILGSLNEGVWPALPDPGPWLSRPMRSRLGLPAPERRIGQAAHDLVQALAAPEVVLTRAQKQEGAPALPARWLSRLDALGQVLGLRDALQRPQAQAAAWVAEFDRPQAVAPCPPPAPRPPVAARPRRLSVTQIETWLRNPYGLYARAVLGLEKLPDLAEDPGPALRGQLIHAALEAFVKAYPETLPTDAEDRLADLTQSVLQEAGLPKSQILLWQPRLQRLLDWYLEIEAQRRAAIGEVRAEVSGRLELAAPGGPFLLTAQADRLELRRDGGLTLVDYKTGALPTQKAIDAGLAPQLPLEGAIAAAGGFQGLEPRTLADLELWKLAGGREPGKIKALTGGKQPEAGDQAAAARAGLEALIARFDDPATPYLAQPRPGAAPLYDDYAHLARLAEWRAAVAEES